MKTELSRLSYDFSLRGSEGGLESLRLQFVLLPGEGEGAEEVREAMRALVQQHTDLLDRLFETVFSGRRQPVLTDSDSYASTGYSYRGRLLDRPPARLRAALAALFGEAAEDDREELPFNESCSAQVTCSALKMDGGFRNVTVDVSLRLEHVVNVCCFRVMKALPDIGMSERARRSIADLDRMLSVDREADHYRAMLEGR